MDASNKRKLSQTLRKHMTLEERILWYQYLRNYPVQWNRQKVLGPYIVDFYCKRANLIVELDGSQHYDPQKQAQDAVRTQYLESQGLKVLRFSNLDVLRQFQAVCQVIDSEAQSRFSRGEAVSEAD